MSGQPLPLGQLSRAELELLRKAIAQKRLPTPLTALALESIGKGKVFARLGMLAGASEAVALALIDLALAAGENPGGAATTSATLVWSGPDVKPTKARGTSAVLLELLGGAKEQVLVVGYEFDHGAALFAPLHKGMAERGVKVSMCVDVRPAPSPRSNVAAYLAVQAHDFMKLNWPFGAPLPQLYGYAAGHAYGSRTSLHAKCVVVDSRHVLIGSANFTQRGHKRNIEVGVVLEDAALATAITQQFDALRGSGALAPLHIVAAEQGVAASTEDEDDGLAEAEALGAQLLVTDAARTLFVQLIQRGLPAPDVGEDLAGEGGGVLGTAELSWGDVRVAVLLPEQEGSRRKLEAAGWACFSLAMADEELTALCDRVRGGRG